MQNRPIQIFFFPYTIVEWNKLDFDLRNAKAILIFRNSFLRTCRPVQNSIYKIHDPLGIKLLTRLRLGLSHLNEHRFKHNFQDCLNPLCSCSLEVESTIHYFLHCHYCNKYRQTLLESVKLVVNDVSLLDDDVVVKLLLYGNETYTIDENSLIIKASIKYILNPERFSGSIM